MRKTVTLLCLMAMLAVATPAQAQLRADVGALRAPAKLFGDGGTSMLLNKLFSPEHFRMGHSIEMTSSSFGGGSTMGMYTNSMMWQFSNKLAARLDLSYAQGFGGNKAFGFNRGMDGGQFLVRNAEIAYRPTENIQLNFSYQQSPYGAYMSPYGSYYDPFMGNAFGYRHEPLFWKDTRR